MITPRELAEEIINGRETWILSHPKLKHIIEAAIIAYGNEKIEECVKLAMNRLAGLSEMYNSKEERGWDRGELAFRQIEARTIIDEIRALKTKKEGER